MLIPKISQKRWKDRKTDRERERWREGVLKVSKKDRWFRNIFDSNWMRSSWVTSSAFCQRDILLPPLRAPFHQFLPLLLLLLLLLFLDLFPCVAPSALWLANYTFLLMLSTMSVSMRTNEPTDLINHSMI